MNEELKQKMRDILLSCYGMDIKDAVVHFSTQNYAFIFPDQPYMIRVSMTLKKTRGEIVSELMWVDDLKAFKKTICEPNISLNNKILEEFEIDGITYRASMFRTARGNVQITTEMTPMFFICVGDLLGTIHRVSTEERVMGMHYKRKSITECFQEHMDSAFDKLDPAIRKKILQIRDKVESLPKEVGHYGICHGDFHLNNFFVEANNIWVFDFDACTYADYMYDVASFVQNCLMVGYMPGKDRRQVIEEDILPYLKTGYELNKKCDAHYWDNLELFIEYRAALTTMALAEIEVCGVVDDLTHIKQFFNYIILQDDICEAMTTMSRMQMQKSK